MRVTHPPESGSQHAFYVAAAAGGTAIAWAYIAPTTALGYLSTLVSGVVGSQLAIRGLAYTSQSIGGLYGRIFPEGFVDPRLVSVGRIDDSDENGGLEIAFIEIEQSAGHIELVPVQRRFSWKEPGDNRVYTRFLGSYEDALLMIAQQRDDNRYRLFQSVLERSSNKSGLSLEDFLVFLCTPNHKGSIPIHSIDWISLEEALTLIQDREIPVDLSLTDPQTGKTLLQKCLSEANHLWNAQKLLEIDPESGVCCFKDVIQSGKEKLVNTIVPLIEQKGISLSVEAKWLMRAFQEDDRFSDEEYGTLSSALQDEIFQVANAYNRFDLVARLRPFHPSEIPLSCRGPGIISVNMDAVQIRNKLLAFFQQKKQEGLLYTEGEFRRLDKSPYFGRHKNNDIGRILGRDFIETVTKQLGITSVKVPRKTIVLPEEDPYAGDSNSLQVSVYKRNLLQDPHITVPGGVTIWAELITPINQCVTREQMRDLIRVIEVSGYDDFMGLDNVIYGKNPSGEEALYFIDTEFDSFRQVPLFSEALHQWLPDFMRAEDQEWLHEQITAFCERVAQRSREEEVKKVSDEEEANSAKYGFSRRRSSFRFALNELCPDRH
jgi:hypothetical protein